MNPRSTIAPISKADIAAMTDDYLWRLHQACVEAISAMMHELEERGAFPPQSGHKTKAATHDQPRRHRT